MKERHRYMRKKKKHGLKTDDERLRREAKHRRTEKDEQ